MESDQPPVNMLYEKYKDHSIMSVAMPAISLMVVINTIGVLANVLVILITISSKNLRSTANFLLAMQCFFDSLHVTAHFYLAYVLYSGKNFDTLPTCYHVMIGPLTGLNFGMGLIFFTAFDRLISMLLPIRHQQVAVFGKYEEYKDTMVVCLIIEGIHGTPTTIWSMTAAILVFGAVFIYIVIGICLRCKIDSAITAKKLYKSLFILCILMMFSWVMTSISLVLCAVLKLPDELAFFIPLYTGITINIACASNFFVLTRYSSDYRNSAREFFSKLGFPNLFKSPSEPSRTFEKSSRRNTITITPVE
ncbi:hypothetical protein FO519_006255 [Halicephalobus sp. NKZ332]|nr:hypothetical protein FO519_006255 [Halicephalobus sp. NKZ332]